MTNDMTNNTTFTVEDRTYEIAFNIGRIKLYERGHAPVMTSISKNGGTFSIDELQSLAAFGLRCEGGSYVDTKRAMKMAEKLIETNGYLVVFQNVMTALERDCGFFFKEMSAD